ncbi:DUF937 domain-containing protein [Aeromicrobium sp.]|uniref:DUF937 domain-containing protein n=1 Tax=Aeromicrobium sp. TaxID=1871063 RepID=UPI002FCBA4C6
MALADDILSSIDTDTLDNIAKQLGIEPGKVQEVLKDSLPALLGGLDKNVQSGDGAASLASALGDHAEAQPLGDLGALISGVAGSGILEKVLGGKTPDVSEAIGGKAGVSGVDVEKILKIAAPIVMAFLASRVAKGGNADPAVVKQEVEKANSAAKSDAPDLGSILGSLLGGAK